MARSDAQHHGLLNRWPLLYHVDLWRFNQISGSGARVNENCDDVYIQFERDYVAGALADAVSTAAPYLGYYPAPVWIEDEEIALQPDFAWHQQTLETRWGHLVEFGTRAVSLIQSNAPVVYSDADGDGVEDTATVTVSTALTDAEQVQVFFRTTDGADSAAAESWRIDTLKVSISGGVATISGHKALFAHPELWAQEFDSPNWNLKKQGDTGNVGDFVSAVDVYRVYADATNAVTLVSAPGALGSSTVSCNADIISGKPGRFRLFYSADSAPVSAPRTVRVSYRAGLALVNGRMDTALERALMRYANTLMPQQPVFCDPTLAMWQEDAQIPDSVTAADTWHPSPFGITNGGLYCWRVISARRMPSKAVAPRREP